MGESDKTVNAINGMSISSSLLVVLISIANIKYGLIITAVITIISILMSLFNPIFLMLFGFTPIGQIVLYPVFKLYGM